MSLHSNTARLMFRGAALALTIFFFVELGFERGPIQPIGGELVRLRDHRFVQRPARADQVSSFL